MRNKIWASFLAIFAMVAVSGGIAVLDTPAHAAESVVTESLDPDKVVIDQPQAPTTYAFTVPVPTGGKLREVKDVGGDAGGEILVENAEGTVIGAYDQAWAQDSAGNYVSTTYRIDGHTLIQDVQLDKATAFPVVIDPLYSPVTPAGAPSLFFVDVPSHYVYNPALGSLHDYCTSSPDQFPNPVGSNADFRGPCARHDLCYADDSISDFTCDNRLWQDMVENCEHEYSWYNPVRAACKETADVYWAAVVAT